MAAATPFQLSIIRRHVVWRWIVWVVFLYAASVVQSALMLALGIVILAVFMEKQWPLPSVKMFGWPLPSHLLARSLVLALIWSLAEKAVPSLRVFWADQLVGAACVLLLILFLCSQVQLLRGRGLE